jgi:hypothetical protein
MDGNRHHFSASFCSGNEYTRAEREFAPQGRIPDGLFFPASKRLSDEDCEGYQHHADGQKESIYVRHIEPHALSQFSCFLFLHYKTLNSQNEQRCRPLAQRAAAGIFKLGGDRAVRRSPGYTNNQAVSGRRPSLASRWR